MKQLINKFLVVEDLFSTNITVNSKSTSYHVIFDHEKYIFIQTGNQTASTFSFKREHDEWINQELVSQDIREQAIDALDRYLFKQH
jgi:plasmid rolling circle replication initiator protein Rep